MPRRITEERKLKKQKEQVATNNKLAKWKKQQEEISKTKKRVIVKDPDSPRCWKEIWVDE